MTYTKPTAFLAPLALSCSLVASLSASVRVTADGEKPVCFVDFAGVDGDGFYNSLGVGDITADVVIENAILVEALENAGLQTFGDLDDSPSFNSNPGDNGQAGASGTPGNNLYADLARGVGLMPIFYDGEYYTVTLSNFSSDPRVILIMNIDRVENHAETTLRIEDDSSSPIDWTTWEMYQDTSNLTNSTLELLTTYSAGTGTLETVSGPAGQESNALFLIVPDEVEVAKVVYRGTAPRSHDLQYFGVALDCRCVAPPLGMALWLPLDETSGTTSSNAAGGEDGTHIALPTPGPAKVQGGLDLGGSSFVEVPSYPAINMGEGDFSIDAWIKWDGSSGGYLIDKRYSVPAVADKIGYAFHVTATGHLACTLADGPTSTYVATAAPVPADGEWHLVALTVDRDDPAGGWFYLDGKRIGDPFDPTDRSGSLSSPEPLRVGSRSTLGSGTGGFEMFAGSMDEVEIFGVELSEQDIQGLYEADSMGKCRISGGAPQATPLCADETSITVETEICNWSTTTKTFDYSFEGLPAGSSCTIDGPTTFSPASGTVTVPPGQCVPIAVTIARPVGMVALGDVGCYRMNVTDTSDGHTFSRTGSLVDRRDLCPQALPATLTPDLDETTTVGPVVVTGENPPPSVAYRIVAYDDAMYPDDSIVSLDGLPPGTPSMGTLNFVGGSAAWSGSVRFVRPSALRQFNIVMETDADGDGSWERLFSITAWNELGDACTGLASQDERVGNPPNPLGFLPGTSGPIIGEQWNPVVHPSMPAPATFFWVDLSGTQLNLPTASGTLLCTPSNLMFFGAPGVPFSVPLPMDCNLVGRTPSAQGGAVLSVGPLVIELYNALDLTVGSF